MIDIRFEQGPSMQDAKGHPTSSNAHVFAIEEEEHSYDRMDLESATYDPKRLNQAPTTRRDLG